jgi:hypothetical protein
MAPRQLKTLDEIFDELVFHEIALSLDPLTKDLSPTVEPLLGRWEEVGQERRKTLRELLRTQAVFSDVNYRADAGVTDFSWDLERAAGNQQSPRFKRYFPLAPSRLVRRALGAMAHRMLGWVAGIKTEPEAEVSRHASVIEALAKEALAAAEALAMAFGARATTRARVVDDYLAEVNAFRMDLQGELQKRAAADPQAHLGAEWVAKFFKPASRHEPAAVDEPESPPAPTV